MYENLEKAQENGIFLIMVHYKNYLNVDYVI